MELAENRDSETSADRRDIARNGATVSALIREARYRPRQVSLCDISKDGCGFASDSTFDPGTRVLLNLPGLEVWPATVTWWRDGRGGLSFHRPLHPAVAGLFVAS